MIEFRCPGAGPRSPRESPPGTAPTAPFDPGGSIGRAGARRWSPSARRHELPAMVAGQPRPQRRCPLLRRLPPPGPSPSPPRPAGRNLDPTTARAAGTTGRAGAGSGPPCVPDAPRPGSSVYSRSEPAPGREKRPLTPEEKARLEAMDPGVRDQILAWLMLGDPILMRETRAKLTPPWTKPEAPTTLPGILTRIREDPSYPGASSCLAGAGPWRHQELQWLPGAVPRSVAGLDPGARAAGRLPPGDRSEGQEPGSHRPGGVPTTRIASRPAHVRPRLAGHTRGRSGSARQADRAAGSPCFALLHPARPAQAARSWVTAFV